MDRDQLMHALVGLVPPPPEVAEAAARIVSSVPHGQVRLPQAVRAAVTPAGYIVPWVQDVLLQAYAGGSMDLARALDVRADDFRAGGAAGHGGPTPVTIGARGLPPPDAAHSNQTSEPPHDENIVPRPQHREDVNNGGEANNATTGADSTTTQDQQPQASRTRHRRARRTRHPTDPACPYPTPEAQGTARHQRGSAQPRLPWAVMDDVDLMYELRVRVPTLRECPRFLRSDIRQAYMWVLAVLQEAYEREDEAQAVRCWKVFILTARMLLARLQQGGQEGQKVLQNRMRRWQQGDWVALLHEAQASSGRQPTSIRAQQEEEESRLEQACAQVRLGNPSRARHTLTASPIAPGNADTHAQLTDAQRRPASLQSPLPAFTHQFRPPAAMQLDLARFFGGLRSAKHGSAPGPADTRAKHLKPLLEQETSMEL